MDHSLKVECGIRPQHVERELRVAGEDVAINRLERGRRHLIFRRIEVEKVGGEDAAGVPQLAVRLDHARQNFGADPDLLAIVHHRDPQADDLGAALRDDLLRLDGVAERLRHLPAFLVHEEAVGQDCPERRRAARAQTDEQRALEPTAMLVAALEVEVRRPGQFFAEGEHRFVARPRVEPDVEDVLLALEGGRAALFTGQALGHELLQRPLVPGVGAVLVEDGRGAFDDRRGEHRFATAGTVERRDWHTPGALAGDAPVRAARDHVVDAVAAPGRNPLDLLVDRVKGGLAQSARRAFARRDHRLAVHPHEPLRGGEENHRIVAAPAVRVGVLVRLVVPEAAAFRQRLHDRGIRFEDLLPRKQPDIVREPAVRSDGRIDVEPVLQPSQVVVGAVAGSGVDRTGALLERHVVGEHSERRTVVQRMREPEAFEILAR